ncbi:MAG: (2Fe-2S) ferredoxin domain-containing protein [Deltaproteobacteria bacterium]|nr:MAG: (2Fe-2S) ferredoxin domain-containing protein [Deltaproteobacteria bacterium]
MREVNPKWQAGCVLVCAHDRPPGAEKNSCGEAVGSELRDWLKARLKADGLKGPVLCAKSSCLGICPARGTTIAVLPAPGTGMERRVFVADPEEPRESVYQQVLACLPVRDE